VLRAPDTAPVAHSYRRKYHLALETVLVATQSHHTRHRISAKRIRRDGSQLLAADWHPV